jgi:hypothetical protein
MSWRLSSHTRCSQPQELRPVRASRLQETPRVILPYPPIQAHRTSANQGRSLSTPSVVQAIHRRPPQGRAEWAAGKPSIPVGRVASYDISHHKGSRRRDEASSQSGDSRSVLAVSTKLVPTQGRGGRMLRLVTKASARRQALSLHFNRRRSPRRVPLQVRPHKESRPTSGAGRSLHRASSASRQRPLRTLPASGSKHKARRGLGDTNTQAVEPARLDSLEVGSPGASSVRPALP